MAFDPLHYKLRVEHIGNEVSRLPRNAPKQLVLLGDGIFEMDRAVEIAGRPVLNMGIIEDDIERPDGGIVRRLYLLQMAQAGELMVLAGFADIIHGKPTETIAEDYKNLLTALQRTIPKASLHLVLLPPTRALYNNLLPKIAVLNVSIEELGASRNLPVIDLFSTMQDDEGELRANYTQDGFSFNETGYEKLNRLMEAHLTGAAIHIT